ncbi:MAG: ABC transporter ATP-binding protein [Desulfohalobiaceae bacterium]
MVVTVSSWLALKGIMPGPGGCSSWKKRSMPIDFGYFEEEHPQNKGRDFSILRRFWTFVRPYRLAVLGSLVLVLFITLLEIAVPYLTKEAIDRYIVPEQNTSSVQVQNEQRFYTFNAQSPGGKLLLLKYPELVHLKEGKGQVPYSALEKLEAPELRLLRGPDLTGVAWISILFLLLILLNFALSFVQKLVMEYTGQRVMHDLRLQLYDHIQRLSFSFLHKNPVGRLVTRVANDVQNLQELFTNFISFVLRDLFMLLGIAAVMLVINWRLALVSFTVLPLVVAAAWLFALKARAAFRQLRIKLADMNSRFSETISGIQSIKLFARENGNYQGFARINHEHYQAGMRQIRVMAIFLPVVEALGSLAVALIVFYGGQKVLGRSLSIGTLVAFISYMRMFFRPLRDIAEKYNLLQNALASAERIFMIMDEPAVEGQTHSASIQKTQGIQDIRFQGVHLAYEPDQPVLQDVNLEICSGEKLALVGQTGSGKTSVINLLLGYYWPTQGRILVNGVDLQKWDLSLLRSRIALVLQDPYIFSGTLRRNILQGEPDLDQEGLMKALENAGCKQLLNKLPQGLDTELSAEGHSLSAGERQLVSIARAFARDPELLILDEATSAVDSRTEGHIQKGLERLMQDRTTITIAHRLSTVRSSDRIVVLHKGRIREEGTHKELLSREGLYFRMLQLQKLSPSLEAGRG